MTMIKIITKMIMILIITIITIATRKNKMYQWRLRLRFDHTDIIINESKMWTSETRCQPTNALQQIAIGSGTLKELGWAKAFHYLLWPGQWQLGPQSSVDFWGFHWMFKMAEAKVWWFYGGTQKFCWFLVCIVCMNHWFFMSRYARFTTSKKYLYVCRYAFFRFKDFRRSIYVYIYIYTFLVQCLNSLKNPCLLLGSFEIIVYFFHSKTCLCLRWFLFWPFQKVLWGLCFHFFRASVWQIQVKRVKFSLGFGFSFLI